MWAVRLRRYLAGVYAMNDIPSQPAFARFEKVVIIGNGTHCRDYVGKQGTIIWLDSVRPRRGGDQPDRWCYIVDFANQNGCRTFLESRIASLGDMDKDEAHLGTTYEISFDVVVEDNEWVQGSYRLPGRFWEVLIMSKENVPELRYRRSTWDSGINGTVFEVPTSVKLDESFVVEAVQSVFGGHHGPSCTGQTQSFSGDDLTDCRDFTTR